ncbi:MAG: hypothetical protein V8S36_08370 [Lachnospiraceae bacterium]
MKHSGLRVQISVTEKFRPVPKKAGWFRKAGGSVLEGRELWFRYEEKGDDILRGLQVPCRQERSWRCWAEMVQEKVHC